MLSGADRAGFVEALSFRFADHFGEIQERPSIAVSAVRATESGEILRVYVDFNDSGSGIIKCNALAASVQPFLESRGDLVLHEDAEGFKICRRDVRQVDWVICLHLKFPGSGLVCTVNHTENQRDSQGSRAI